MLESSPPVVTNRRNAYVHSALQCMCTVYVLGFCMHIDFAHRVLINCAEWHITCWRVSHRLLPIVRMIIYIAQCSAPLLTLLTDINQIDKKKKGGGGGCECFTSFCEYSLWRRQGSSADDIQLPESNWTIHCYVLWLHHYVLDHSSLQYGWMDTYI